MNAPAPSNPCTPVRALASRYLDGRLGADSRARVHAHLKECSTCLETYRSLQRLSTLARALPRAAAPVDLARRVRRTVSERRQETLAHLDLGTAPTALPSASKPTLRLSLRAVAIAAGLIASVSAALFTGYKLGRMDERGDTERLLADLRSDRDRFADQLIDLQGARPLPDVRDRGDLAAGTPAPRQPALTEIDPGIWKPYREQGFHPEQFVRSAQALWSDLASYEQLDPQLRRPLLSAQLACFDLPTQARVYERLSSSGTAPGAELDQIASFVLALSTMLESSSAEFEPARLLGSADPFTTLPDEIRSTAARIPTSTFEARIAESARLACANSATEDPSVLHRLRDLLTIKSAFVGGEIARETQSHLTIQLSRTHTTTTYVWRIAEDGERKLVEEHSSAAASSSTESDGQ